MRAIAFRIAAGLAGAILLAIAALYILQLGPFALRPSPAAKAQPKVQAAVEKARSASGEAVAKAEMQTQTAAVAAEKKAEIHVAAIRRTTARAVPADVPDAEFYRGVCSTQLYARDPECRGYGGQP